MGKRFLALVLCVAMVLSVTPHIAKAATTDVGVYQNDMQVQSVLLPQNKKVELTAFSSKSDAASYQWQILAYEDVWVDIANESAENIALSYAMVANLLHDGVASVRCKVSGTDAVYYSDPVNVTVDYSSKSESEVEVSSDVVNEIAVTTGSDAESKSGIENNAGSEASGGDAVGQSDAVFSVSRMAARSVDPTYNVVINYVFKDGSVAADPWTATVVSGSTVGQIVVSPTVVGYTPDATEVVLDYAIIEDTTITVTYLPALVEYTVVHYQQNLNDDNYTEAERVTIQGYTESAVGDQLANSYEGFYALLYDTTTAIAADGSTVVEVYYDRYYYLMSFDLDGGYGVEPIYARYGVSVSVGTPTKAGYTFDEWKDEEGKVYTVDSFPYSTMPAKNTKFTALWTAGTASFMVVFWYENANDDGYTTVGNMKIEGATSGSEVSSGTYQNTAFDNRDNDNFTYNADMAETVKVAGDGSTVLNVYFTRNVYTITFVGVEGGDLTCNKTEHEHSNECCSYGGTSISRHWFHTDDCCTLGLSAHEHSSSCYSYAVTAKYDSDISSVWTTEPIKSMLDDGYVFQSSVTNKYYSFLEKMPDQDIDMTATKWSGNEYKWYYYLEVLPGADTTGLTTRTDNGKTYYLYDDTTVYGTSISLTYAEDYYPITGFTQRDSTVPEFKDGVAYLYYTRNSYNLSFVNYGTTVSGAGGTYLYQADISGTNFTPTYPGTLEPDAYVFEGWYTSPFYGDTKIEFTSTDEDGNTVKATMPAYDLTLYARWVPKNHNVNVYLTSDMNEKDKLCDTQVVAHGSLATEPDEPTNGRYTFVGWFYMDGETEKAFDFSMSVNKDLNIYARWSSNVLMEYTIRYAVKDENGNLTYIADDTTGSALAGTTKTFAAKSGSDLYKDYQEGYYPETNSHSLIIDIENPTKNVFTFIYVAKTEVAYTVKYLEFETEKVLHEQKVATTRAAVITETFEAVEGYMPDAYQKRLVLSADEAENVIIFWYVKDATHAPVQIIHYIQNVEGDGYQEYQSSADMNGVIGNTYGTDILSITGFKYDHATANDVAVTAENGKVSGKVSKAGLILKLYYNRNSYPYEFKFLEQGTNTVLADSVTGKARYGAQVTENAKNIPGYTCHTDAQDMIIQIESGEEAVKNVRTFYYTEDEVIIKYVAVGPADADDFGSVSLSTETVKVFTGTAAGSTPIAADSYRFVGWYYDEDCTRPVTGTGWLVGNQIKPQKDTNYGTDEEAKMGYVAETYYAKFEKALTDLTITKAAAEDSSVAADQTFVFTIEGKDDLTKGINLTIVIEGIGSVTIVDIPIGSYEVEEQTNWSWQYAPDEASKEITLTSNVATNVVTFTNRNVPSNWLTSTDYNKNVFKSNN